MVDGLTTMSRAAPLALLAILLAGSLAGCLGGSGQDDAAQAAAAKEAAAKANLTANLTDDGTMPMNATAGAKPHNHDYWKGRERVTVFDADLNPQAMSGATFFALFGEQRAGAGGATFTLPDGQIVYEGTGKMEFTATYSDPTVSGVAIRYHGAEKTLWGAPLDLPSTKATTIEVTPEMSDEPHSSSSKWGFLLESSGNPGVANGKVHLKIDIIKMRNIELFPAHPDYFANRTFLKVMDKDVDMKGNGMAEDMQILATGGGDPPGFPPEHVIPMDTKTLLVRFELKSITSANPAADTSKYYFLYRAADTAFRYRVANSTGAEGKAIFYKIPVGQGQGDSFYAKTSQWLFVPYFQDNVQGNAIPLPCPPFGECFAWEVQGHATIYAFKDDVGPEALKAAMASPASA